MNLRSSWRSRSSLMKLSTSQFSAALIACGKWPGISFLAARVRRCSLCACATLGQAALHGIIGTLCAICAQRSRPIMLLQAPRLQVLSKTLSYDTHK